VSEAPEPVAAGAARYPVLLDLADRPCLVVGGGPVAARKARGLVAAGARVTVVAREPGDEVQALAEAGALALVEAAYDGEAAAPPPGAGPGGRWTFVAAATDDRAVNRRVVADATAGGAWANDATDPRGGPAALPAVRRDGPITVAVATGGAHPGAARWLADRLVEGLGPEHATVLAWLDELAPPPGPDGDRADPRPDWRTVVDSGTLDLIRAGRAAEAKERLQACLSSSSD
jgi:siroheme synthase-like protein